MRQGQSCQQLTSYMIYVLKGPQIVTVPTFDTPKRYWIVPFLDAYLNYYGVLLKAPIAAFLYDCSDACSLQLAMPFCELAYQPCWLTWSMTLCLEFRSYWFRLQQLCWTVLGGWPG